MSHRFRLSRRFYQSGAVDWQYRKGKAKPHRKTRREDQDYGSGREWGRTGGRRRKHRAKHQQQYQQFKQTMSHKYLFIHKYPNIFLKILIH